MDQTNQRNLLELQREWDPWQLREKRKSLVLVIDTLYQLRMNNSVSV